MKPNNRRKALSALLVLALLASTLPLGSLPLHAAEPAADTAANAAAVTPSAGDNNDVAPTDDPSTTADGLTVSGGALGTDYSYDEASGTLTILTGTPLTISGDTTTDHIVIGEDVSANLMLAGVDIQTRAPSRDEVPASPIDVPAGASLTLSLAAGSTNMLYAGSSNYEVKAGIHVPKGATLFIKCAQHSDSCPGDDSCGKLTVRGRGSDGGGAAAAIGGNSGRYTEDDSQPAIRDGEDAGTIVIDGGRIEAQGVNNGTGIGGGDGSYLGDSGDGGAVTINGGYVNVSGEIGIGGGAYDESWSGGEPQDDGDGGTIKLNGGVLENLTTSSTGSFTINGGELRGGTVDNATVKVQGGAVTNATVHNIQTWNDDALTEGTLSVTGCTLDFASETVTIQNGGQGNTFTNPVKIEAEAVYDNTTFNDAVTVAGNGTLNGETTFNGPVTFNAACTFGTVTTFNDKGSGREQIPNIVTIEAPQHFTGTTNFNNSKVVINGNIETDGTINFNSVVDIKTPVTLSGTVNLNNTVNVQAPVTLSGTTTVRGTVTLEAALTNTGALTINGTVTNSSTLTNEKSGSIYLYGTLDDEKGKIENNGAFYIYENGKLIENDNNGILQPNVQIDGASRPVPAGEVVIDLTAANGQKIVIGANSYTIGSGTPQSYDPAKNNIVLTGEWTGNVGNRESVVTLEKGLTSTIILRDAAFNVEAANNDFGYAAALALSGNCTTTLLLEGTNTVTPRNNSTSMDNRSVAIRTASTASLTIDGDGTLNLNYDGSSWRVGIGSTLEGMGTITVNGGNFKTEADQSLWNTSGFGLFFGQGGGDLIINDANISGDLCFSARGLDSNSVGENIIINGGTIREDGRLYWQTNTDFGNNHFTINGGSVYLTSIKGRSLTVNGGELVTDVYCVNDNSFVINGGVVTIDGTRISAENDNYRTPTSITGGSVKMIYSDGTQEQKLPYVGNYYLTKLDNQNGVTSVLVDGEEQNIVANHPNDAMLYFYLKHDNSTTSHTIVTLCGSTQNTYTATWNNDTKTFDVTSSGTGSDLDPEDETLPVTVGGAESVEGTLHAYQKVVGSNVPMVITIDLSKVNNDSQPPTNGILGRPMAPNSDPSYALNTVILYCNGKEIDRRTVRSNQQQATFYVQTETWLPDDYVFTASYAAYGSGSTQLALSEATTLTIVPKSLETATVVEPTLSGTYGDKISKLNMDGGSVTLGDNTIDGEWTIDEEDQNRVLGVGTTETITLIFNPQSNRYGSITREVTPTIAKKELTASISDTPTKTYDGTKDYKGTLTIELSGVVESDKGSVTAKANSVSFNDANAGTGKIVTASGITLSGNKAKNYTLTSNNATTTGEITKATATPNEGALNVKNGYAATYEFDLSTLLPTLDNRKSFGTVTYSLNDNAVDLENGYNTDGAKISGSTLTLPINLVESNDEKKQIGTITVTIKSDNYDDMPATITVFSENRATQTPPAADKGYTIDFTKETMTADSGYELSTDSNATEGKQTLENIEPDSTVYVRKAGNAEYQPSAWTAVELPERPEAPTVTAITKSHNSITVTAASGSQYKLGKNDGWQDSGAFTGLTAGTTYTISVRTPATETAFASKTASVKVTTLSENGSGTVAAGETATRPDGTTVTNDGKTITITGGDKTTTIQPAPDSGAVIDENGSIQAPAGSTVTTGDGPDITIGDKGAVVTPDGEIILPGGGSVTVGDTTITAPDTGGTVTPNDDGTVTLPGGSTVESGGAIVTLPPEGGTLTGDGDLNYGVTVTFDSRGGTAVPAQENIPVGKTATEPARPSKGDNTFNGWYTDPACTQRWDFSWPVEKDMTLYAGWTPYTGSYNYPVTVTQPENGNIVLDKGDQWANEGERVTITVTPDKGYRLDQLTITSNGREIAVTDNGDGTYTFTMPSSGVKIEATFVEDPNGTPEEPGDESTAVEEIFTDVNADDWFRDVVQYVYDEGLMTGTSATTFEPNTSTTRAMIVAILYRQEGGATAADAGFTDVAAGDWYADAVNWAASEGIVAGFEDGTFQPNAAITREQMASILYRYAAYKGRDVSARTELSGYSDAPSPWAESVMQWAVAEGLLNGVSDDQLQPQGQATRAQVAAILQRFLENVL